MGSGLAIQQSCFIEGLGASQRNPEGRWEEDPGSDLFIDICRVRLAMVTVGPAGRCSILSLSVEGKRGHY